MNDAYRNAGCWLQWATGRSADCIELQGDFFGKQKAAWGPGGITPRQSHLLLLANFFCIHHLGVCVCHVLRVPVKKSIKNNSRRYTYIIHRSGHTSNRAYFWAINHSEQWEAFLRTAVAKPNATCPKQLPCNCLAFQLEGLLAVNI